MIHIGIDVGGTKIEGMALDDGRETARVRVPTPREDYDATIETIAAVVGRLEAAVGAQGTVGVGIPGSLAPEHGLVRNANSTWLIGRTLGDDLERRLGRKVRIANDANCFAVSEATDGAGAGAGVVFGVIVGTGVGAGIVVQQRLVEGINKVAGEWGHNPLPWAEKDEVPGPMCYCGRHGCIERFLAGPALESDFAGAAGLEPAAERRPASVTAAGIVERAASGDAIAEDALRRYESRMARALAGVINLLDPDVIVLGGGMSNVERLYARVPALWDAWVFGARDQAGRPSASPVRTRLVRARHGDSSGVRGAAWLWAV